MLKTQALIWTLFYGESVYGPIVYKVFVFSALFGGLYSVVVNTLQEGLILRNNNIKKPILMLGNIEKYDFFLAYQKNLTISINNLKTFFELEKIKLFCKNSLTEYLYLIKFILENMQKKNKGNV